MKKCTLIVSLCAGIGVLFSACTKDSTGSVPGSGGDVAVVASAGIGTTRASDTDWEANDAIGVTMTEYGSSTLVGGYSNYKYVTQTVSGIFKAADETDPIYFPQDGRDVTIRAYYPYNASVGTSQDIPVDVSSQLSLPLIDLMTATHNAGFSKDDPNVELTFYHRLSKVIFVFDENDDNNLIDLDDLQVTIRGMRTRAIYELLNERFVYEDGSVADIGFPLRDNNAERYGIVLPRAAGSGVEFTFSSPTTGDSYSAFMGDELELEGGKKYTFHVTLSRTEVTISATIEDWVDGPTTFYDALQITVDPGKTTGVDPGTDMNVYFNNGGNYELLRVFTYKTDGRWYPDAPAYWEDLPQDPTQFRASILNAQPLNNTQMADILIADDLSVERNKAAHFTLRHATAKLTVRLRSGTFSEQQLETAEITMLDFRTGAYEENGSLVPGNGTGTILMDRSDLIDAIALVEPQTVPANTPFININIEGRTYKAPAGNAAIDFEKNTAYLIYVTLNEADLSVSVTVVDWENGGEIELTALTVGTAVSGGTGVMDGEQLMVYTGDVTTRTPLATFVYDTVTDEFTTSPAVYWEDLDDPTTFYGSIFRNPRYNDTQLDEILVATPRTVSASNGVDFTLTHPQSQLVFQLTSEDGTFSDSERAAMNLTLPNYTTGATVVNGLFVPGTGRSNIIVAKDVGNNNDSAIAIIQPQTVGANQPVVQVSSATRTYDAITASALTFRPNESYLITIDMSKTGISFSAEVIDWADGGDITLVADGITIGGSLGTDNAYFEEKTIYVYKLAEQVSRYPYSYQNNGNGYEWTGPTLYWEDQTLPLELTGVFYPFADSIPTLTASQTSFDWSLPTDQSNGYANNDLLMSHLSLSTPWYANFIFTHVLSRVRVEITAPDFTLAERQGMEVILNDFIIQGEADLTTGKINPATNRAASLIPQTDTPGEVYTALVMPQTIDDQTQVLTVNIPGYPDYPFSGVLTTGDLDFIPGKTTVIRLNISKTAIVLTAELEGWTDGEEGSVSIN